MIILLILAVLLALIITLLIGTLVNIMSKHDRPIVHKKINEETLIVTRKPVKEKAPKVKAVKEYDYDLERMIQVNEENERLLETRYHSIRHAKKEEEIRLAEERRTKKIQPVITEKKQMVTYTKIKFYRSNRELIYVVPKNTYLIEGQKIKVRIDEDTVRVAKVIKGNYTREKYKGYEYKTIEIVK